MPKKINLFIWRLVRDGIPTNINLFGRGVDVNFFSCKLCSSGIDVTSHLFTNCDITKATRSLINDWIHLSIPEMAPNNLITWVKALNINGVSRKILESIIYIWWWHLWKERNNVVHNGSHDDVSKIFNSIVATAFLWISNRDRKHDYGWIDWIANPLNKG